MLVSVYRLKVVYEGKLPIFPDILHCEVMTWVSAEALSPFLVLMAALLWEATRLWFLQFFIVWTKAGVVSADAQSWGNISEPIKCCRPSMAALRMCMSPRGKAHICLYIFMCVCVGECVEGLHLHSLWCSQPFPVFCETGATGEYCSTVLSKAIREHSLISPL